MLRQIQYFQAVVRCNSFSQAAEESHISQSAISQQVKALETELGFPLLDRKNRKFSLTPAGTHFYQKSLVWLADFQQLCRESQKLARGDDAILKIGYLRNDQSAPLFQALNDFSARYPRVSVQLFCGNHEELFHLLRTGGIDLALNDQRRAFSEEYVNLILSACPVAVEVSARSSIAALPAVSPQELKHLPCIVVASEAQQCTEENYLHSILGFQGEFLRAESLEQARLLVVSDQGYLPTADSSTAPAPSGIRRIPLLRGGTPVLSTLCLFWKKDNSGFYVEEFAHILKNAFL